jgi:hypothetical protein
MLGRFDHTCHLSIMKWKQGESTALGTARVDRERLIPLFDMPPAGDFDHEKRRPLSPRSTFDFLAIGCNSGGDSAWRLWMPRTSTTRCIRLG